MSCDIKAHGVKAGDVWLAEWLEGDTWIAFYVANVVGNTIEAQCFACEEVIHKDTIRFCFTTDGANDPFIDVCRRIA